jgi:hypothetical protein
MTSEGSSMRGSSYVERIGLPLLLLAGAIALSLQVALDRPVLGGLGLLLFVLPGYAIVRSTGPRPLAWPEVVLAVLGATLAITVLAGVVAGLLPSGLQAGSVAILELLLLAAIAIIRLRGEGWEERSWRQVRRPLAIGGIVLAGAGATLAAAGLGIAARAATEQAYPGFVQFWSLPPAGAAAASVGIRNLSGSPLSCGVAIDRPDRPGLTWQAGDLAPGQGVVGSLPRAEPGEAASWRLALTCVDPAGQAIERQLSILPPT